VCERGGNSDGSDGGFDVLCVGFALERRDVYILGEAPPQQRSGDLKCTHARAGAKRRVCVVVRSLAACAEAGARQNVCALSSVKRRQQALSGQRIVHSEDRTERGAAGHPKASPRMRQVIALMATHTSLYARTRLLN
jgi:hypothetical protein